MKILRLSFLVFFTLIHGALLGQVTSDSLHQPIVVDTLARPIKEQNEILDKVKTYTEKKNIWAETLRNFITFEKKDAGSQNLSKDKEALNIYLPYQQKVIRKLKIVVLDPFGQNISMPDSLPPQWLHRAGNFFHIKTQLFIIKNALLFKKGDRIEALQLSETERVLRQLGYIYDAKINVDTLSHTADSVDVTVVAQDIWSISANVSLQNFSAKQLWAITGIRSSDEPVFLNGQVTLRDVNFMGLGTELLLKGKRNNLFPTGYNWDGEFNIANIAKSFVSSKLYRYSQPNLVNYGVVFGRTFFSPLVRWAGGGSANWVLDAPILRESDSLSIRQNLNFDRQDAWVGYAFPLPCPVGSNRTERIILSLAYERINYWKKPADTFLRFQDQQTYLFQFGYATRSYFKDNYLFGLGRTEDIPAGGFAALVAGFQNGEYFSRPYLGARIGKGWYHYRTGFLFLGAQSGYFIPNQSPAALVVNADVQYFGRLYRARNWKFRHFFWLRYAYGEDPTLRNRMLNVNDYNGVRGLNLNSLPFGNQRLSLNLEANIHMPFNILGFRFAWVVFADFALLSQPGKNIWEGDLFQGYGLGLRFRNEHMLFFNTLQIQFAYYPNAQVGGAPSSSFAERNPEFYRFNQFDASKPNVVGF